MKKKRLYYIERTAAILAAIIFLQTLYFKFTAHPDSVHIFTVLGGEPYTRIGSGIVELIIAILLLFSRTSFYGALLGIAITLGAIGGHIFKLGIVVNNDSGTLFTLAITCFLCCILVFFIKREQLKRIIPKIF
tara:strand:- start:96488 stop:96886 length:399 start_codon:yes stop_codon:yes gene_type:complete